MRSAMITPMGIPTVTALYGSLNAILNVVLAARVSIVRREVGVSIGLGTSKPLEIAIRAHANNAEFMPLTLVMLLIVELCGGSSLWLHVCGGLLLTGRITHAIGLPRPSPNVFRVLGVTLTWGLIVGLSAWALWLRRG